jgi:hypothetical protein
MKNAHSSLSRFDSLGMGSPPVRNVWFWCAFWRFAPISGAKKCAEGQRSARPEKAAQIASNHFCVFFVDAYYATIYLVMASERHLFWYSKGGIIIE